MKKNKKRKQIYWQAPTAILLLVLGFAGFLWVFLPPANEITILQLQEIRLALDENTDTMLQQSYQMEIKLPKKAKAGKQFGLSFALIESNQPVNITSQDVDIFDHYQLNISLIPELENTSINPPGSMTTALQPDQEPVMAWKLQPIGKDPIEGTFWVYADFIPLVEGLEGSSTALLARNITIPVQTILGFNANTVTIISTILSVAAIFLGLPQLPFFKGEKDAKPKK